MDYMDKDMGKILKNNAQTLRHDLLPQGTDCFRVYDRNLSRYPVTVDVYGKYAKITDYGDEALSDESRETLVDICSRMLYLEKDNVIRPINPPATPLTKIYSRSGSNIRLIKKLYGDIS